jgi:NAD(P)H dehydrogenase (quinone)
MTAPARKRRRPVRRIIDDWGLRDPGVKQVEHVFFYGAAVADPPQIQQYLRRARQLGRDFAVPARRAHSRDSSGSAG